MDKLHSKLGKKLSNRYLGSDAFTSSTGRFGIRTVSRLGSVLKSTSGKRYYGVGQRVGLFEFKNIVIKVLLFLVLISALAYTIPVSRYATHRFFTKTFALTNIPASERSAKEVLLSDEAYVVPRVFQTDSFIARQPEGLIYEVGTLVYDAISEALVGIVSRSSTSTFDVMLFSDAEFKGNFFTMSKSSIDNSKEQPIVNENTSISTSSTVSETSSTTTRVVEKSRTSGTQSISFEGVGYGQMIAKVPPQTKLEPRTHILAATPDGLKPVAEISHVEPDKGSSFMVVYAQLLVPPVHIYKIRLVPIAQY